MTDDLQTATALHQQGRLDEAEKIYLRILDREPANTDVMHLLALVARRTGNIDRAENLLRTILDLSRSPRPQVFFDLALILHQKKNIEEAIRYYRTAVQAAPDYADAWLNMGSALAESGGLEEAVAAYRRAVALQPNNPAAYNNLGLTLLNLKHADDALKCFETALKINPDYAECWYNAGNALVEKKRYNDACNAYRRALNVKPDYYQAAVNLGNTLRSAGDLDQAIHVLSAAQKMKPDDPTVHYNAGLAFAENDDLNRAAACFEKALDLDPNYIEACDELDWASRKACDWDGLTRAKQSLDALIDKKNRDSIHYLETPFRSVIRYADSLRNYKSAVLHCGVFAEYQNDVERPRERNGRLEKKDRITIGYASRDFYDHPTMHLMAGLFKLHDRDQFDVQLYSYGPDDESEYRKIAENDCDRFFDITNLSDFDAAQLIDDNRVDILIDLKGHTQGARLGVFALKPAPVQVSYLGFPGTTGAGFLDYVITDRITTPESESLFYAEKPVYMPDCYQVNDRNQPVSSISLTRRDAGLPESGFVFCSFNNSYKIEPDLYDVWMELLRETPESVLWLLGRRREVITNIRKETEKRGVSPGRIVFGPILSKPDHLARLSLADLALDTKTVNGHTTTSDALWAGVPVVTIKGGHFASRVSASLLNAAGLPELVAAGPADYKKLCLELAGDLEKFRAIKNKLVENRLTRPLFDTRLFVRHLENAYRIMWNLHLNNEPPRTIDPAAE